MSGNTTLLIDANNLGHIAFFTTGGLSNDDDESTGTIFGFLNSLLSISKKLKSNKVLFFWDSKKSFRKMEYPVYKAHRKNNLTPEDREKFDDMYYQFDLLRKEILPDMGFNVYQKTGFEADDLIAYYCKHLNGDSKSIIISTDTDLFQLLTNNISVYNPSTKKTQTPKTFEKKYGITPDKWVEVKSIAGDSSDNIDGVHGVGIKTAVKYIKGEMSSKTKKYFDIWHSESLIIRNRNLVRLPYTKKKLSMNRGEQRTLKRIDFIKVFDRLQFIHFLNNDVFSRWEDAFNLK